MTRADAAPTASGRWRATLLALVAGQVFLHSTMAGLRMAAPLWALGRGEPAWTAGLLIGLFATAPVLLALPAGRAADRYGYHRPLAVAVAMTVAGGALALLASALPALSLFALGAGAILAGAGANLGLIVIQRTAGRGVGHDPTRLRQVFGWLGLAPALSNVVGPVVAGALIDHAGYATAFGVLGALPLVALWGARFVPVEPPAPVAPAGGPGRPRASDLLRSPGIARLFVVNWLVSASWDAHSFVVPVLGHERGFSASAIGTVLGVFAGAVALVRLAIPVLAHRLREAQVVFGAMLVVAAVLAVYPLARSVAPMSVCAALLGLALGSVQPMVMTALHRATPAERHGEAIALRSMTLSLSSAVMPVAFGLAGASLGAASLFWVMGALVLAGSGMARRIGGPS